MADLLRTKAVFEGTVGGTWGLFMKETNVHDNIIQNIYFTNIVSKEVVLWFISKIVLLFASHRMCFNCVCEINAR